MTWNLQPLDLGFNPILMCIIATLGYVLSKIDACEVVNPINIYIAIRWVIPAWEKMKVEIISKCFRKAGILDSKMDIVSCDIEEDP